MVKKPTYEELEQKVKELETEITKREVKRSGKNKSLDRRAEKFINNNPSTIRKIPPRDIKDLIEDLRIYQTELEMQNEVLRQTQLELDAARDKYVDLYDFAPSGYFTINEKGVFVETNLTAAIMLGVEREALMGKPFSNFINIDDKDIFYLHHRKLIETKAKQTCELRLVKKDKSEFYAHLESKILLNEDGDMKQIRLTLTDITELKELEEEREKMIEILRLINRSRDKKNLIKIVTGFLRDWLNMDAVGVRLSSGDDYPYYETRGFEKKFVSAENYLCARDMNGEIVRDDAGDPELECMCGNVIRGRTDPSKSFFTEHGSFWTNSTSELLATTTEEDRQARTRNRCNGAGYESVVLVPLRTKERTYGLIQFNDFLKDKLSEKTVSLLERVTDQLAYALADQLAEEALQRQKVELKSQAQRLEEVNTALKVLIQHRDEEKAQLEESILSNMKQLIFPYIEKMDKGGLGRKHQTYLEIVKSNLEEIVSPFAKTLSSRRFNLTPTELRVADLIKNGKASKEIAQLLGVSVNAISVYRYNIRKKLGLLNKKINLISYLRSDSF